MRTLARHYLESFATKRAPLLADPRAAVIRALALAVVTRLVRGANVELAILASRTLEAHLKGAPSRSKASRKDFATASALLADIGRASARAATFNDLADRIQELFANFENRPDPLFRWVHTYPKAVLLTSALNTADPREQLIAARNLLVMTRGLARRIGYRSEESESHPLPVAGRAREGSFVPARNYPLRPSLRLRSGQADISPATGEEISRAPPT